MLTPKRRWAPFSLKSLLVMVTSHWQMIRHPHSPYRFFSIAASYVPRRAAVLHLAR